MRLGAVIGAGISVLAGAGVAAGQEESVPAKDDAIILFVIDNSASLPPLDPEARRRDALEKLYTFLEGRSYRLILFGGRREIYVDAPDQYLNTGQYTDFYFAFLKTQEIVAAYPPGTRFKQILITDGILDPSPDDWADQRLPPGADVKQAAADKAVGLLGQLGIPLYVILVGDAIESDLVERMIRAANGSLAGSQFSQGLSSFFDDDGVLVRRFLYRVQPEQGLRMIEPAVRRIVSPPRSRVEISLLASALLFFSLIVGVGVRSFPGKGDREILEMRMDAPLHVAIDRLRRLPSDRPAWSWRGLSLVESAKQAAATLTLIQSDPDFPPEGLDLTPLDARSRELIHLPLPDLGQRIQQLQSNGDKDDTIFALNLDYAARDLDSERAARILSTSPAERRRTDPMEFLRAKSHLLHDDTLYHRLTRPRVSCVLYGQHGERRELVKGSELTIGRYTFAVEDLAPGGRKDYRLVLAYERVPSVLSLKKIVPAPFQKLLRLRRSHERVL